MNLNFAGNNYIVLCSNNKFCTTAYSILDILFITFMCIPQILRSFVVRPSKLIIQSYDDRIQNTTSIRHVRSPETSFNITISLNAAKYTRVFDPRIQLGSPKRLHIARIDWDPNLVEVSILHFYRAQFQKCYFFYHEW